MQMTDEGAELLLGAIAEQAVKDYKRAWNGKIKRPGDVRYDERMNDVERFFKGRVFKWMFPRLNGPELFSALRAECAKWNRKNKSYCDKRGGKP